MKRLQLSINQKIEFIHEKGELGTSLVQDFGEDFFLVTIPLKGHLKKLLHIGDIVTGIYYDDNGKLYLFKSKVLKRIVQNIPMYKLSMPERLSKVQRRNHVRIPVTIPIRYAHITSEAEFDIVDQMLEENNFDLLSSWKTGTALDLSGGGVNIHTEEPLDSDKLIIMQLDTEGLRMGVKGKVVRSYIKILNNQATYEIGIKFVEISESGRDKIIGFVFNRFRDRKQKGV